MGVGGQHNAPAALPVGRRLGTLCTGGWVGPRAVLHGCGKSLPHHDLIPIPSGLEYVAVLTMLSQPTLHYMNVPYFVVQPL